MDDATIDVGCGALFLALGVGWVLNLAKFFLALGEPLTGFEIARALGIFVVPIGCIIGWL